MFRRQQGPTEVGYVRSPDETFSGGSAKNTAGHLSPMHPLQTQQTHYHSHGARPLVAIARGSV